MVHIRVRGRTLTFAAGVTLVALLPFLGASAPQMARQSVVLAAGASDAVAGGTVGASAPAYPQGVSPRLTGAVSGISSAIGGGLFQFPSLALPPGMVPPLASPLPDQQSQLRFIRPVLGAEASGFGPRMHPVLGVPMFHTGIDLAAACGTPIRAAAAGTVVYAQVSPSWGARTIIQHSPNLKTAYGHQSKFLVKEGDVVKQGDIIGLVGTTGWSTGCHLHFDVILNERYVDPGPYLGLPSSHAPSIPFVPSSPTVRDSRGVPVHIEDGDVPIPAPTSGTSSPWIKPPTSTTTKPPLISPTTTSPTTPPTTDPTTDPTTTEPPPTTTTEPPATTTTTSEPPATTSDSAPSTSEPAPTTDSQENTSGTDSQAATSEPTATSEPSATSEPATSEPSATADSPEQTGSTTGADGSDATSSSTTTGAG
ncbi:MAG TPA: peptidoglycan DD-metalloendopeptidase family protein [Intrasporangium sp.]|uniref:M23 family metallopeptidase n=1 Tax=Intrasporangium sp. TaxID=1925024 RepID=UPI002F922F27